MKPRRRELAAGFVLAALGTGVWMVRGGLRAVERTPGAERGASEVAAGSADAELRVPIAPEAVRAPEPVADPAAWVVRVERDGTAVPGATVAWMTFEQARIAAERDPHEDLLARLRRVGWTAHADPAGEARVPPFTGAIGAWDGEWATYRAITGTPELPIVLSLEPKVDVEVHVVDGSGAAVAGVRVHADLGDFLSSEATDGQGIALFQHLGRNREEHDLVPTEVVLSVGGPGLDSALTTFPWAEPPSEPVVLVIGPHGSIVAETVDGTGATMPVEGSVWIEPLLDAIPGLSGTTWRRPRSTRLQEGVARWGAVGLGRRFRIAFQGDDRVAEPLEVDGPTTVGQEVRVALFTEPAMVARVLRPDGAPLEEASVVIQGGTRMLLARTEAGGQLSVPLRAEAKTREIVLLHHPTDPGEPELWQATVPIPPGARALGDVRLASVPELARGRVVDRDGTPVSASLTVTTTGGGRVVATQRDVGDGFVLFGTSDERELRVQASGDFDWAAPVTFRQGARDVEIVVERERPEERCGLELSFASGQEDLLYGQVLVQVVGGSVHSTTYLDEGGHPRLEFSDPGAPVTVTVEWRPTGESLRVVPDVRLVPGATVRDPRLQDIDLGARLRDVRVRVRAPDGSLAHGWVEVVPVRRDGDGGGAWVATDGVADLRLNDRPATLRVHAEGARTQEVRLDAIATELDVRLEPAIELEITPSVELDVPPGAHLEIACRRQALHSLWEGRHQTGSIDYELAEPVDVAGSFRFLVPSPGRWQVVVMIAQGDERTEARLPSVGISVEEPWPVRFALEPWERGWGRLVRQP